MVTTPPEALPKDGRAGRMMKTSATGRQIRNASINKYLSNSSACLSDIMHPQLTVEIRRLRSEPGRECKGDISPTMREAWQHHVHL